MSGSREAEPDRPAMAVAAFGFGLGALLLSPFLVGLPLGGLGLGLGVLHLFRGRRPRALAICGSALSALAMLASLAAGIWYVRLFWQPLHRLAQTTTEPESDEWAGWRGKPVPEVRLTTVDGETIGLTSSRDRVVILDFWATWCHPCIKTIPHLNSLSRRWGDSLAVVGISGEDLAAVERFRTDHPMQYRVVAGLDDQKLPEPFSRVSGIPTLFFVDEGGILRSVLVGYHDYDTVEAHFWVAQAAGRHARGRQQEALWMAGMALEDRLDDATQRALRDAFGDDPAYVRLHDQVRDRVEGLLGHYERTYGRTFERDRTAVVWAIWSLGAERKDKAALPYLARYLKESVIEEARWRAADALWRIGDHGAVPHLVEALDDPSPRVSGFAASGLGELGDVSAVGPLLALFDRLPDNREGAKARVADALGKLGDPRAIGPLAASLEAVRDAEYARWAQPALRRLQEKARSS